MGMLATLLLVPGFQTFVVALATLWVPLDKIGVSANTEIFLEN